MFGKSQNMMFFQRFVAEGRKVGLLKWDEEP